VYSLLIVGRPIETKWEWHSLPQVFAMPPTYSNYRNT